MPGKNKCRYQWTGPATAKGNYKHVKVFIFKFYHESEEITMPDFATKVLSGVAAIAEMFVTFFCRDDEPFDPSWMDAEKWRRSR